MIRRIVLVAWLAGLWLVLWGDPAPGTVFAGVVVGGAIVALTAGPSGRTGGIRPGAVVVFTAYVAWKILQSNLVLAREILTRRDTTNPGIIEVPLVSGSGVLATVVANAVSLTPGTLTLEVFDDPPRLYVHVLHLNDRVRRQEEIRRIEQLARRMQRSAGGERG